MADSVSNKQTQRRLAKESTLKSESTINTNRSSNHNHNHNLPKSSIISTASTINISEEANSSLVKNNKATTSSADTLASAAAESREDIKRKSIGRSAKTKAKEAITSILLPHNTSSSIVADTSKFASSEEIDSHNTQKIDQLNNSKHKLTNSFASAFDNNEDKESTHKKRRSRSSKRRRSQSSTTQTAAQTTLETSRQSNKKHFKANTSVDSDKSAVITTHNLRSSRRSSSEAASVINIEEDLPTTSRKTTRKNSVNKKTVPIKKPKLSDINNNLNLTESTRAFTSSSSSSSSSPSSSSSRSTSSNSRNSKTSSPLFASNSKKLNSKKEAKIFKSNSSRRTTGATETSTLSTKELGNTCNIRSKETTGGCITRPTLRRSSQQQQVESQEASTVATSQKRQKSLTNNTTSTAKTSTTRLRKGGVSILNNMNQQNPNVSNNASNSVSTTTTTTATTTVTTTTSQANNASTFASLFSNASLTANTASSLNTYSFPISESESDDNADFSRLTDILQARGLPSHIVNAFGNKVQQFLSRTMSSGITGRSQQLIQSLQQTDESIKLTALTELCQLLVMGNEDTLAGFPIKQAVPLLLQCLNSESDNYDLMNHACRALTYMMESLPRSSSAIAEGIPIFLEKLQSIQCMDVAEQALTALENLSRRNSKQILHSNGINACLTYIDFFSITAQRNALQITANCCQNMIKEEFIHIQSSLSILAQRLTHSDKKSVESVCTIFSRLVENFQRDQTILKEIASHKVLANMQQLLVVQPQLISSAIFVLVLHTMDLMCINCTELAVELLQNNIADTLKYLLVGPTVTSSTTTTTKTNNNKQSKVLQQQQSMDQHIELISRPPQELYEIVSLISEILPKLPQTGIFQIDDALKKSSSAHQQNHIIWQWKDEREIWRPYTQIDSRIIEAAFLQEEDEVSLSTMGRTYVIDFNTMLQINEETGTARPVIRKVMGNGISSSQMPSTSIEKQEASSDIADNNIEMSSVEIVQPKIEPSEIVNTMHVVDHRGDFLGTNAAIYAEFVRSLFGILYEVYSSSAGPAIKHRCLRALLRMIYYTEADLLNDVLRNLTISSHIASMLASQDLKIIVCALQMCDILMQKLPTIFSIYFHREGVIHQIDRLIETYANTQTATTPVSDLLSSVSSSVLAKTQTLPSISINNSNNSSNNNNTASNSNLIPSQTFPTFFNPTASAMWPYNIVNNSNISCNLTGTTATTSAAASNLNIGCNSAYKLTPFGMDTIIGNTLNMSYSDNKATVMTPTIQVSATTAAPTISLESPVEQHNLPTTSTSSKQDLKIVETLKRKVRTPKRPGRKSNKNEQEMMNISSSSTASNFDMGATASNTGEQQQATSVASASKYVQNVMSRFNNNNNKLGFSNNNSASTTTTSNNTINTKSSTITTSAASTPQHPLYMSLYSNLNSQVPQSIQNLPSYHIAPSPTNATTTSSATNRNSDYSFFGSQLWSHLRGASSLMLRNPSTSGQSAASNSTNKSSTNYSAQTNNKPSQNITTTSTTATTTSTTAALRNKKTYTTASNANTNVAASTLNTLPTTSSFNQLIDYNTIHFNKEKVRTWIYEQAKRFKEQYFPSTDASLAKATNSSHENHPGLNILQRLNTAVNKLSINSDNTSVTALKEISNIIYETDISSFEMIHSGLITKLLEFLTSDGPVTKFERLKQFLHIFANLPLVSDENYNYENKNKNLLTNLISKLHNCVNQLEQYAVRVHDVPNSIGYGKTAIKFFNTHQLKCLLQRHPDATTIRQWKGGPVKVDPLAVVSAIEKYLTIRGMNKSPQANDSEDSDNSDDDIEEAMSAILGRSTESNGPRLELLINGHVLPSNITIYQAIKQYTLHADTDNETDTESFVNNEIWSKVHTINYKLASTTSSTSNNNNSSSNTATSSKTSSNTTEKRTTRTSLLSALSNATASATSKTTSSKRGSNTTATGASTSASSNTQENANDSNQYSSFFDYISNNWKKQITISDLSLEAISLLRLLYALNRNWYLLYHDFFRFDQLILNYSQTVQSFMINSTEFVNSKLTAKANRQLQDPLVIMTGHLPKWLPELVKTCGFLFPFETRLMFFYASSFDRDRAMQRLLDLNSEIGNGLNDSTNSNERIVPKIDRKKKTIVRDSDILKQSENILNEFGKSKALLEIQYENEVGTGLGPTLEFYALVSLEVQKVDYELWRGDKIKISTATGANQNCLFYFSPNGLFPAPLAKNAKQQYVNKIRNKFKFFGKFVAKAIMDFRILDIQLSVVFHKWLLDQSSINDYDIKYVDSVLYRSLESLKEYLHKHKSLVNRQNTLKKQSPSATANNRIDLENDLECVENEIFNLDKAVKDLDLDFTLPGYNNIELKKNGKDTLVNLFNLEEYLKLVTQWTLIDGVQRQFESFKEGFNSIFPINSLNQFYPEELERLFCGSGYDLWDSKLLIECTRCDHGFTHDSKAVQFLFEILSSMNPDEQRLFLQFVTGSPRLPVGGLRSLNPQLTIVRKTIEGNDTPDNYLPSVMTCVNYLKLPDYSNVDIMRTKLFKAMTEGQLSFNLS